ncbi:HEPN domain-containing protein [Pyrococcus abyssi]|uniref:HEPN domain-containing protein n=1 Tax=Pyrococcus abyssi (strain GE5 / Orsay) TaxID=272844 RepID=Q9UZ01_PYRAB|nr:HEPN domain-containing protein [Pyrococcus abyssi]CAB50261.1 Hypothetical protein PAB0897 [Pyrococcus abyssi GE5]CCE70799.1 TPA: hypothetical protein PAB0897 [Pyrococcus abyssi GE5]
MHYEEVEMLFHRSKDYMSLANVAFKEGKFDVAIFLAGQSLQLYLKATLVKYADLRLRTHSIRELLINIGKVFEMEEKVVEFIRSNRLLLRELEDAYIDARYEPRKYSREDAEELIEFANKVMAFVEGLVNEFERRTNRLDD